MAVRSEAAGGGAGGFLDTIERIGNKVPHPAIIFLILLALVIALSHALYLMGTSVTYQTFDLETDLLVSNTVAVNSLLTADGIRFLFTSMIRNFMGFGPVGVILVAMIGVGLAEQAGLVTALIKKIVSVAPAWSLTYIIVFVGVLSSIAADAGYLVLIPLGAAAFLTVGRHPIAGIAAAFAGVAAVFLVNVIIVPVDGILTEITNDAIHLLDPNVSIDLAANLYFSIVCSIVLTVVVVLVTERVIEPRLGPYHGPRPDGADAGITFAEAKGLRWALLGLPRRRGLHRGAHGAGRRTLARSGDRRHRRQLAVHEQPDRDHHADLPGDRARLRHRRRHDQERHGRDRRDRQDVRRPVGNDLPPADHQPVHRLLQLQQPRHHRCRQPRQPAAGRQSGHAGPAGRLHRGGRRSST